MDTKTFTETLKTVEIVVITTIPAIYAIGYTLYKRIKQKKEEIDRLDKTRRLAIFNNWEHEESMLVTSRVKSICNYYKDQGDVDLVSFYQIENGTVARSKLCNMFLTCLVEDDRFGNLTKYIHKLQRIPYSQISSWVEKVRECRLEISTVEEIQNNMIKTVMVDKGTKSSLSEQVRDSNGWFLGICLFEYSKENYNGGDIESQRELMSRFSASITSTFINYHVLRLDKLRELKLSLSDVEVYKEVN